MCRVIQIIIAIFLLSGASDAEDVKPELRARAQQFVAMMSGEIEPEVFIEEHMSRESREKNPAARTQMIFGVLQRFYRGEKAQLRTIRETPDAVILELSNVDNSWAEYELLLQPGDYSYRFGGFNARILGVRAEEDWKNLSERALTERLRKHIEGLDLAGEFSGSVLLTRGATVLLESSVGPSDAQERSSPGPTTTFPVASVSKSFTAAAIWVLVEQGKVDLGEPIGTYLSEIEGQPLGQASVREILEHRSGLQSFTLLDETTESLPRTSLEDLAKAYSELPLAEPGRTVYSNAGAVLLGWMIERVAGVSFGQFLQHEVFNVAGMRRSGFLPKGPEVGSAFFSQFEDPGSGEMASSEIWFAGCVDPSKSALASASDLHSFAQALFAGKISGQESIRDLIERSDRAKGEYANGLRIERENGIVGLGHSGSLPGVSAQWWYFPDSQYGIFVTGNHPRIAAEIADRARTGISFREHGSTNDKSLIRAE